MQLYPFEKDPHLTRLRNMMGADKDGGFVLFDPERHTTLEQRDKMKDQGLKVISRQLIELKNRTLGFLDCRVLAKDMDGVLHLTKCLLLRENPEQEVNLFISLGCVNACELTLCSQCHERWQQSQAVRRRQRAVMEESIQSFMLSGLQTIALGKYK